MCKSTTKLALAALFLGLATTAGARSYYISPTGSDRAAGTEAAPWATLGRAQQAVTAGDTVWMRGGTYRVQASETSGRRKQYNVIYDLNKSGERERPICYFAYPGERPVFDFSEVRPEGRRVSAFSLNGSWLHLKGFDIVGVQVTVLGHTQSECISACGGSHCIVEEIAMHDGMAIGYYQTAGSDNLVLNCDAYCNYDPYSEGPYGGNVDGFGGHVLDASCTGNVFRGCRAWWNSDDGFDLIRAQAAYTIDHCWSFLNGYQPRTLERAGDGTGFKSGGYGMKPEVLEPAVIPMHRVTHCIAYQNKNKGFYANHHLGGIYWENNTGYRNPSNFCMLNRQGVEVVRDTTGYGHVLTGNVSLEPTQPGRHLIDIDTARCVITRNSFAPVDLGITAEDFESVDAEELMAPRQADGSLPEIHFLKARRESPVYQLGLGYED
jgi:hypothetical protein